MIVILRSMSTRRTRSLLSITYRYSIMMCLGMVERTLWVQGRLRSSATVAGVNNSLALRMVMMLISKDNCGRVGDYKS